MKPTAAFACLAATLISVSGACAQAPAFKVPFDFTVGNQVLPAGTYQVGYYTTKNAILIHSPDERFQAFFAIHAAESSKRDDEVVFTQYGNQYFLHEVLCGALSLDVALPTSKREKRARVRDPKSQSEVVAALRTGAK